MGRKFASTKGKSFAELNRTMSAERDDSSNRIKDQWDDLHKFVPAYELNQDHNKAPVEQPAPNQNRKRKKKPWQTDEFSFEIRREIENLHEKKKRKKTKKQRPIILNGSSELKINGAEVLGHGGPPSKHVRTANGTVLNGTKAPTQNGTKVRQTPENRNDGTKVRLRTTSENSNSSSKASPSKSGQLVTYSSANVVEEEESSSYFVTTPSDEEAAQHEQDSDSEQDDFPFVVTSFYQNDYEDSSEEEYGIDLDEESVDFEEEEEGANESDMDFINDDLEEDELSPDELDQLEEKIRKKKPVVHSDESSISGNELNDLLNDSAESTEDVSRPTRRSMLQALVEPNEEYESESDDDFDMQSAGSAEDDEEELASSGVDDEELNDLLLDITGGKPEHEYMDDSTDDHILHLEPEGLILKPIGLAIDDYSVDESEAKFLKIQREKSSEPGTSAYSRFCFTVEDEHSVYTGIKAFKWLIGPVGIQDFFDNVYGKRAMIVQRRMSDYYNNVFPLSSFYGMFQENFLEYGVNINIANYTDGVRTTHNPQGRAYAGAIRSFIDQGMSVQCVNPQSFNKDIHYLCEILQDLFNCFVGANCYYTPKGSSGFAPHYDDIDAFLVQTVGKKYWKVYAPSNDDLWPLESSGNFTVEEMAEREDNLVFEGWLKAGDVLYLPRGFIHCAKTDSKHDSLHVTISCSQQHTYSNLLEKVVGKLVESKTDEIPQLRRNLPIDLLDICGVADTTYENDNCLPSLETPIHLYLQQFQIGLTSAIPAAVDDIGRDFIRKSLPPLLTDYEKAHSIHGVSDQIPNLPEFASTTQVRLIRKHTQRLLFEGEDKAFLVHRFENSVVYEGRPEVMIDVPSKLITGVERLLKTYPNWESIEKIGKKMKINVAVVQFLYNCGLLMVREAPQKTTNSPVKQLSKKNSPVEISDQQRNAPKKKKHRKHKH